MNGADPLSRLHLLQEKKDLEEERIRAGDVHDLSDLEKQFVKVAKSYGERKGISYGTWRTAGVSAASVPPDGAGDRPDPRLSSGGSRAGRRQQ